MALLTTFFNPPPTLFDARIESESLAAIVVEQVTAWSDYWTVCASRHATALGSG